MNPDVPKHGRSFRAAWQYYCHDKLQPGETERYTSERVAFTHTENLPVSDPAKAWRWMAYTGMRQDEIKRAAGGDMRGRKMDRPVYAYSLSWHPSEQPSKDDMIAAARESLRHMGLHEHEAFMVAHADQNHPHIHVVVNKVHPQTGRGPNLSNDYKRLQKWAYQYEKTHGKVFCRRREFNILAAEQYRNGKQPRPPTPEQRRAMAKARRDRQTKAEFHRWRREQAKLSADRRQADRDNLTRDQKHQRDVLFKAKEEKVTEARTRIREDYRPHWRRLYQRQKQERRDLETTQRTATDRLNYWLRNRNLDRWANSQEERRGFLKRVYNKLVETRDVLGALDRTHEAERRDLGAVQKKQIRETLKGINQTYRQELADLKERQAHERQDLSREQDQESSKKAQDLKSGRTFMDYIFGRDWKKANPTPDRTKPEQKPPDRSKPPELGKDWEKVKEQRDERSRTRRDWDDARDPQRGRHRDGPERERSRERRPKGPGRDRPEP